MSDEDEEYVLDDTFKKNIVARVDKLQDELKMVKVVLLKFSLLNSMDEEEENQSYSRLGIQKDEHISNIQNDEQKRIAEVIDDAVQAGKERK